MTVQTKDQSIWKLENAAPIAKMGIEGVIAATSLVAAMTTILIAASAIAGPAFLASVANPVGIAALLFAAVYFAAAAYSSYQQMNAMENVNGAPGKDGVALSDKTFKDKLSTFLSDLEVNGQTVKFKGT